MCDNIEKISPNFRTISDSKSKFIFLMSQENINILLKFLPYTYIDYCCFIIVIIIYVYLFKFHITLVTEKKR